MKGATKARAKLRELSHQELEACELEAHGAVPEDATEEEAQDAYAVALHKLIAKQRTATSSVEVVEVMDLDEDEDPVALFRLWGLAVEQDNR